MLARIYKPARNAMQSGMAKTRDWVLEFAPEDPKRVDPLMGWQGSGDMRSQVRMSFESKEAAIDYAERNGIPFQVQEPKPRKANIRPRGYGENFAHNRRGAWTH
ncbi:ETC complex I subunit [Oceanicella sp. SM1341]|uniref:ETC complex I subunit n=1 Tax=Oceanicella sp. SM1341 TaxID=1548889 RepID=UPI000E4C3845|nr:ETC complex I subunit [Oceanicella sp. SM1341]